MKEQAPLWSPSAERVARSNIVHFAQFAGGRAASALEKDGSLDYGRLHRWSIESPQEFWGAFWRFSGIVAESSEEGAEPWSEVVHGFNRMAPPDAAQGPVWFPRARLNFAENLLRYRDDHPAIVSWGEVEASGRGGRRSSLTYEELYDQVMRAAAALKKVGVGPGDRVAAYMPNVPETIVAMLAAASLGAIWSSCSPDFGVQGVLDRFGQIEPRVLIAADGYRYSGKVISLGDRLASIVSQISSIERVVVVPVLDESLDQAGIANAVSWSEFCGRESQPDLGGPPLKENNTQLSPGRHQDIEFARLPFNHPLYILYSSGTTGLPKCMVHGAGGTLIQHLKEHLIHTDLSRSDRIFYFTTCGWMMWNWLASALATGATIILYDGAPLAKASRAGSGQNNPGHDLIWQMAEEERITVFGTSAKYLALAEKEGIKPGRERDLSALKAVLSTGSPLAPLSFDYVYRDIKSDLLLSSISGGTDIVSCFAAGNPAGPVWRGEIQAASLGMDVAIFDDNGTALKPGEQGELVCRKPFPSMPVSFWNDPDGSKYRSAYFDHYPGVWRHGDWAHFTEHGGVVITGRSDATLNPGGVRIGTAEIYRQVEKLDEVVESLVVGQEISSAGDRDVRIVLFVRLREGFALDDELRNRIKAQIREHTSPHHVPRVITQVADIPRTISGKITELAVREVIHGRPVRNIEALANPASLDLFRDLPELSTT